MKGATPWLDSVPRRDDRDEGETGPQRQAREGARAGPAGAPAAGPARAGARWRRPTARSTGTLTSVAGPGTTSRAEERPDQSEALAAKQDPAEHDEVERHEPAEPRGRPEPAAEGVLDDQARAVERAPEHEGPRRAVPEAAEDHRQHQVAVGEAAGRRGCRRAGCRGSRAASATASCASGARSRGTRSRGTGCGSSGGRRTPSAARARSRCRCSPRSRSRSARCTRTRRAATSGAA